MTADKITLATCANNRFFGACLTLIESAQRTSRPILQEILVYDLGLAKWQKWALDKLDLVTVVAFPEHLKDIYPGFMDPIQFAWKTYLWLNLQERAEYGFYIDAGIEILQPLQPALDVIKNQGILIVEDPDWTTGTMTHQKCIEIMQASTQELDRMMLCAGIVGVSQKGPYKELFKEAFEYAKIPDCIRGPRKKGPNQHRQDQSLLSILSARYNCPRQALEIYGEWRWDQAKINPYCVLHVHRKSKGIRTLNPSIRIGTSTIAKFNLSLLFLAVKHLRNSKERNGYQPSSID
jgi:hypothetical protein